MGRRFTLVPNVMPAHPEAPEGMVYRPRKRRAKAFTALMGVGRHSLPTARKGEAK